MRRFLCLLVLVCLGACATQPKDYTLFKAEKPKSILILPPLNSSTEVMASYSFFSTISKPVAEKGYYVFPVAVIDQLMKQNGLPGPGEMHQASLRKIREIIQPDAVLYIALENYGTKFHVIDSNTTVTASARLVSARSGKVLWENRASANHSAMAGQQSSGLLESIIASAVAQAVNDSLDQSRNVAMITSERLVNTQNSALLDGPYLLEKKALEAK